ncbi:unnamed protein product [Rotaria sordida]|uniref:MYND-type domain-containing protein n=1 Tax=Rotaria sordida TaxID=392033 RepID=A0A813RUM1_9BILA|nr:unnamed protein product [Rotaria sordida]CAF1474713.1 unnamed protein product [Rotaria sordida]
MRCIAANRSVLTALDQNTTLADHDISNCTATTNDIDSMDIIQFADGWYSYPDLNTFDSDLLLATLTLRNIKPSKAISPWNIKLENSTGLPLTEIGTRQLEALFNLSQLLFGLARAEQSNYTFRDLQLGKPTRQFREAGFNKFPNNNRSIDFFSIFQLVINDILKSGAIDIVYMMYKDPRIRCVKQKSLDLLTNVTTINEIGYIILNCYSQFLIQLLQGIRDGHLIEEKIPSLSVLIRLCKVIVEKNLLNYYQNLIDMQFIDILIDLFEYQQYKSNDLIIYFIKFESLALQCLYIILQCVEHFDMWSEKAQIRLVNYCCTLLYKSILDNDKDDYSQQIEINHIIYAEQHEIIHSLCYSILIFLSIVRCRKEIGRFYRENEHFRELLNAMRYKYNSRNEYLSRNSSISCALNQLVNSMFDRHERKKRRNYHHLSIKDYPRHQIQDEDEENDENRQYRKCSNSLCQMIENNQIKFEDCPYCHKLSYCSQYCREVHWTLNHNLLCRPMNSDRKKEESTVLCKIDGVSGIIPLDYQDKKTTPITYNSAFETLPVQISHPIVEATAEITNNLCYPSSSNVKKKSLKTLLSLLRVSGKRR